MPTQQIDWGDGSGGKIYLSYSASAGDQAISVSSDANTGYNERTKTVTFQTTNGSPSVTATLIVKQAGKPLEYFWFKARTAGSTISMNCPGTAHPTIYYSTDKTTWQLWDYSAITLSSVDDQIWFKGSNTALSTGTGNNYAQFVTTGFFDIGGDITALLREEGMVDELPNYAFRYLFRGNTSIVNAREASINGVKRARNYCCESMFYGCTNMITAPKFTCILQTNYYTHTNAYSNMFYGCSSLNDVSGLDIIVNGTSGSNYAAAAMFRDCISLTSAPKFTISGMANYICDGTFYGCSSLNDISKFSITATSVGSYSFQSLFRDCTSLNTVPNLPFTSLNTGCFQHMFRGCTSLSSVPSNYLPFTTMSNSCYGRMFYGCTSLTTAPILPALTLVSNCYQEMFRGCSNLVYIKAMFTTTPSASYTSNWVYGVASTGTFVKNSAAGWAVTGTSGVPTGWTVQTASS